MALHMSAEGRGGVPEVGSERRHGSDHWRDSWRVSELAAGEDMALHASALVGPVGESEVLAAASKQIGRAHV